MRRRGIVAGVATAFATLAIVTAVLGYWLTSGGGTAAASTKAFSPPTAVSATFPNPTVRTIHVTWTGTTSPAGSAVTGYYVQRSNGSTSSNACGSSPASLLSGTTTMCDDTAVPSGTYAYTVTAVFNSWTSVSSQSGSVTVPASALGSFTVSAPASATAGTSFTVAVTALDQYGATYTSYSGALCVTFSGPHPSPSGTGPSYPAAGSCASGSGVSFLSGTVSIGVTLVDVETTALTVTDNPSSKTGTSGSIVVTAGTATKLRLVSQPVSGANIQAGTGSFPASVAVQDANGNTEISDSTTSVTLGSNPAGGLSCTNAGGLTVTASAGVASFTGCAMSKAGTGYTLTALSSPTRTAPNNANSFNVTQATPTLSLSAPAAGSPNVQIPAGSIIATLTSSSGINASGTIAYRVFGPQPSAPTTCTSAGTAVGSGTSVTGNQSYNPSAGFTPTTGGTYWWFASYGGDSNNNSASSTCGAGMAKTAVSDTLQFTTPGLHTVTVPAHVTSITFNMVGGGGGGAANGSSGGAGGSLAGTITLPDSTSPTTFTVIVGGGGMAGVSNTGGVGGTGGTGCAAAGVGGAHRAGGGGGGATCLYVTSISPIAVVGGGGGGGDNGGAGGNGSGGSATNGGSPGVTNTGVSGGDGVPCTGGGGGSTTTSGAAPYTINNVGGTAGNGGVECDPGFAGGTDINGIAGAGGAGGAGTGNGTGGGGGGGGEASGGGGAGSSTNTSTGAGGGGGSGYSGGANSFTVQVTSVGTDGSGGAAGAAGNNGGSGFASFTGTGITTGLVYSATGNPTTWTSSTAQNVAYPAGTNTNDLLFLVEENSDNVAPTSPGAPWTQVADQSVTSPAFRFTVWWRLSAGESSAALSVTTTNTTGATAWIARYVRVGGYPPNPAVATATVLSGNSSTGATLTPGSVITNQGYASAISIVANRDAGSLSLSNTQGFGLENQTTNTPTGGQGVELGIADEFVPASGTTAASPTWSDGNGAWAWVTLAFS